MRSTLYLDSTILSQPRRLKERWLANTQMRGGNLAGNICFRHRVVISLFAAYLSGRTLAPGATFSQVFRVVGTVALLGYGAAHAQESIWSGRSWVVTLKHLFDSVIYAALTAGTFGWLWPKSL
jgi:hypothetical protein